MNKFLLFLLICFSISFSTTAQAIATETSIDYRALNIEQLKYLADKGDPEAKFRLGIKHELRQNYEEALKWYELSGNQGHLYAQYRFEDLQNALKTKNFKKLRSKNSCLPLFS